MPSVSNLVKVATLLTCIREAAVSNLVGARFSEIWQFSWQNVVPNYAWSASCQYAFSVHSSLVIVPFELMWWESLTAPLNASWVNESARLFAKLGNFGNSPNVVVNITTALAVRLSRWGLSQLAGMRFLSPLIVITLAYAVFTFREVRRKSKWSTDAVKCVCIYKGLQSKCKV